MVPDATARSNCPPISTRTRAQAGHQSTAHVSRCEARMSSGVGSGSKHPQQRRGWQIMIGRASPAQTQIFCAGRTKWTAPGYFRVPGALVRARRRGIVGRLPSGARRILANAKGWRACRLPWCRNSQKNRRRRRFGQPGQPGRRTRRQIALARCNLALMLPPLNRAKGREAGVLVQQFDLRKSHLPQQFQLECHGTR